MESRSANNHEVTNVSTRLSQIKVQIRDNKLKIGMRVDMRIPNWHKLYWKEQSNRKDTMMAFWWGWCGTCESVYLECPSCGNNSCNGGYGEIDGVPCEVCCLAHAYEELSMKTGQYPKTREECEEYNNKMLAFFHIDKEGNLTGFEGRTRPE